MCTERRFLQFEIRRVRCRRRCTAATAERRDRTHRQRGPYAGVTASDGKVLHDRTVTTKDHAAALALLAALPDGPLDRSGLIGFGHRVVHGGPDMAAPVLVDAAALAKIEALEPLAPLHNPPAVAVLKALSDLFPGLPRVACFDTGFHRGHPPVADGSQFRTRCIAKASVATVSRIVL